MNKKGDIPSILYAIVAIAVVGIIILFASHMNNAVYTAFGDYFEDSPKYNNSIAHDTVVEINTKENALWDYVFLGIAMGYLLITALSAYSTRISPIFYWIYGILTMVGIALSVMLSNAWQEMANEPVFADTIARLPITNLFLGNYYPTVATALIVLSMILLFGKNPNEGGAFG